MGFTPQKPNQNTLRSVPNKKCPIIYANPNNELDDCLKERCGFWIEIQKCCSIKLIATSLGNIEYREKLKHHIENKDDFITEI